MRRFRTHWLALLGAMLLLSLSMSSAFGAHPTHADNRGGAVSAFVHELLFGTDDEQGEEEEGDSDEDLDEDSDEDSDDEEQDEELLGEDGDNHGQCVSEIARDHLLVGANDTHGWAVSEAARETCRDDGDEDATEDSDEEEEGDEGDEGDEFVATATDGGDRGNSAAAHQKAPGKNKAEGARAGGNGNAGGNGKRHGNR